MSCGRLVDTLGRDIASSALMTKQFNSLEAGLDKMLAALSVGQAELATHPLPACNIVVIKVDD